METLAYLGTRLGHKMCDFLFSPENTYHKMCWDENSNMAAYVAVAGVGALYVIYSVAKRCMYSPSQSSVSRASAAASMPSRAPVTVPHQERGRHVGFGEGHQPQPGYGGLGRPHAGLGGIEPPIFDRIEQELRRVEERGGLGEMEPPFIGSLSSESVEDAKEQTLLELASCGNIQKLATRIADGFDKDTQDPENNETALMAAARNGHTGVVKLLLDSGARKDLKNTKEETALHLACAQRNEAVVRLLANPETVNIRDESGGTPLMAAAKRGSAGCVEALLEIDGIALDAQDDQGKTALHHAAKEHGKCVALLLGKRASPDVIDREVQLPLHHAASAESMEALKELLAATKDPNTQDKEGKTSLHHAVENNRLEAAKYLVGSEKVDPNRMNHEGETPLHFACYGIAGDFKMALQLIESKRANVNAQIISNSQDSESSGRTPMHIVVMHGKRGEKVFNALMEAGVDVFIQDGKGQSCFDYAKKNANDQAIIALLKCQQKPLNEIEVDGLSLIEWASLRNLPFLQAYLNEQGIFLEVTPEIRPKLEKALIRYTLDLFSEIFGQFFPFQINEITELTQELKAIGGGSSNQLEEKESVQLFQKAIALHLDRLAIISKHRKQGSHTAGIELLPLGTGYEMMSLWLSLMPSSLKKKMPEIAFLSLPKNVRELLSKQSLSIHELQRAFSFGKQMVSAFEPEIEKGLKDAMQCKDMEEVRQELHQLQDEREKMEKIAKMRTKLVQARNANREIAAVLEENRAAFEVQRQAAPENIPAQNQ